MVAVAVKGLEVNRFELKWILWEISVVFVSKSPLCVMFLKTHPV